MTRLSVNLNKVALLRNSRNIGIPSVLRAAELASAPGRMALRFILGRIKDMFARLTSMSFPIF